MIRTSRKYEHVHAHSITCFAGKGLCPVTDLFSAGLEHYLREIASWRSPDDIEAIHNQAAESLSQFAKSDKGAFLNLREQLTDCVLGMSKILALIINPEPEADPSGFRGEIGISGQLRDRLLDVYSLENYIPEFRFNKTPTFDELYHATFFVLDIFRTTASAWNHARIKTEGKTNPDWFKPFVAVTIASEEEKYRKLFGLPGLIGDRSPWGDMMPLLYQTFFALVASGAPDPYAEWLRGMCARFLYGSRISSPPFS